MKNLNVVIFVISLFFTVNVDAQGPSEGIYYLKISDGTNPGETYLSSNRTGDVDLWHEDGGSGRQKWNLIKGSDGFYNITILGGTNSGETYLASSPDGRVNLWHEDGGSGREKWDLIKRSDGFYNIKISDGTNQGEEFLSCTAGGSVDLYDQDDGEGRQRWVLEPTWEGISKDDEIIIRAKHSGKVLDVKNSSTANGGNVLQYQSTGYGNQEWNFELVNDGYYKIINKHSGKVLEVYGGSTANGANISQYDWLGGDNQLWKVVPAGDGYYKLVSKKSGKDLAIKSAFTKNLANVILWTSKDTDNHKFSLEKLPIFNEKMDIIIRAKHSEKVLNVKNSSTANSGNVLQYQFNGSENQRWNFEHLNDGYHKIVNKNSGKVLEVHGGSTANEANISQYDWLGGDNQLWKVVPAGDGYYKLVSKNSGKDLAIKSAFTKNLANAIQWTSKDDDNHKFQLEILPNVRILAPIDDFIIRAKHSNKVLDVEESSTADNGNVLQYQFTGYNNQRWNFEHVRDGYHKIINIHSGKVLDVRDHSMNNGANIIQYEWRGTDNQLWKVVPVGGEYYKLVSKRSGKELVIEYASTDNSANAVQWDNKDGSNNHKFKLEKSPPNLQIQLEKIVCVNADDGGGSAEELHGHLYVEVNGRRKFLWTKSEAASVEMNTDDVYEVNSIAFYSGIGNEDEVKLGGHLYENDDALTNPNDDLGDRSETNTLTDLLASPQRKIRYTHEGTKIDVYFKISRPSGKFLQLRSVKCKVPSMGTDGATAAGISVGIIVTSAVIVGVASVSVGPLSSAFIPIAAGGSGTTLITTFLAVEYGDDIAEAYGKKYPGKDDLYLSMEGRRIWPDGRWKTIGSQETETINKIYLLNRDLTLDVLEYDSGSDDDYMGTVNFPFSGADALEPGIYLCPVVNESEGSYYELEFEIIQY